MSERTRFPGGILMIAGVLFVALVGLVVFSGCAKKTPTAQEQTPQPQAQVTAAEQTTCPVMGGAINKAIFVEYQGKKVYFCCAGCPEQFKADPAKYLAKLPQFQK